MVSMALIFYGQKICKLIEHLHRPSFDKLRKYFSNFPGKLYKLVTKREQRFYEHGN